METYVCTCIYVCVCMGTHFNLYLFNVTVFDVKYKDGAIMLYSL